MEFHIVCMNITNIWITSKHEFDANGICECIINKICASLHEWTSFEKVEKRNQSLFKQEKQENESTQDNVMPSYMLSATSFLVAIAFLHW